MLATPDTGNLDYDRVYEPSEDTFLLLDCFEKELEELQQKFTGIAPVITEIGAGSGMVTSFIMSHILPESFYMATDINPHACLACLETTKINNKTFGVIDCCQMDLTSAILPNSIDLLVFNPPYVPAETVPPVPEDIEDSRWVDLALLGGPKGMTITWKLLDRLEEVLTTQGVAYILFCARNEPESVQKIMESRGWHVKEVIRRKAGWEVLSILRFMK